MVQNTQYLTQKKVVKTEQRNKKKWDMKQTWKMRTQPLWLPNRAPDTAQAEPTKREDT